MPGFGTHDCRRLDQCFGNVCLMLEFHGSKFIKETLFGGYKILRGKLIESIRDDIVAANILADVLVALTPVVTAQMKPGAIYILSGIIDDKEAVVKEAVQAAGLELMDVNYQGEWVGITARKPIV